MAIPLFILAGIDQGDNFGQRRIGELKFKDKLLVDYLISEAKKSDCFSEIFLVEDKELKEKIKENCRLLEAKKRLWMNIKIIFSFSKKHYQQGQLPIAILLSDILPSAEEIKEIILRSEKFPNKDIFLLFTPTNNLKKRRGKMFVKKDKESPAIAYSGTGGLYVLKPGHLNTNLILSILGLRLPREIRHFEIDEDKIYCDAIKSFRGIIFFVWMMAKIIFYSLIFIDKLFLLFRVFTKLRKKELTIEESEYWITKILVKKKYQKKEGGVKVEMIDNPVFVNDIDKEEDLKLLEENS